MTIPLKQSTASQSILIGPFVDSTDGVTAETGLTISNTDIRLSKNGGNLAAKNSGGGTHDENGWYTITLNATDTNTVGRLQIHVNETGALPVWVDCEVFEEAVYDDLFGSGADPFTVMQSDIAAIHSQTTVIESDSIVIESSVQVVESDLIVAASDILQVYSDTTIIASDLVLVYSDTTAIHSDTTIIASDIVHIHSDTTVIESDTTVLEAAIVVTTGALEGTPSSTVLQTDLPEATDDHYNNMVFMMTSGDEAGESRRILDYTGATGTVTLDEALSGSPTATETFVIVNQVSTGGALTAAQASDLAAIESDLIVVASDLLQVYSDTTIMASDLVLIYSDTTAIHSDTTIIASDLVQVYSDTAAIHSDTTIIASDVVLVYSDTTAINTDTANIYSDTTIIASDLVLVYSDTTAIHSDTTIIHSDTTAIETGVNVASISGDSTAADNLELMYDGTGYTDDTAPASRSQVGAIGSGGSSSFNFPVSYDNTATDTLDAAAAVDAGGGLVTIPITGHSFVVGQQVTIAGTTNYNGAYRVIAVAANTIDITATFVSETFGGAETIVSTVKTVAFTGSQTNTYANTESNESTYHTIDDDTNAIDIVYTVDVGSIRQATQIVIDLYLTSSNDSINVQVYDQVGDSWETFAAVTGTNGSTNTELVLDLFAKHTGVLGDADDEGLVYLRFTCTGQTNPQLNVARIITGALTATSTQGYEDGSVWCDESNGTSSGTTLGVDGVFANQCDDFDNAQTIADSLGTQLITNAPGTSITLTAALSGYTVNNVQATLNGGSQDVDSTRFNGGFVAGTFTRAGTGVPTFSNCNVNGVTSDRVACLNNCGFIGTFTLTEAGVYVFNDAQAGGATSLATFDVNSQAATLSFQRWSGDITFNNLVSGATVRLHCSSGGDIVLNGADATVNITGAVGTVTNNLTGSPTVTDNGITLANINTEVDTAIVDADLDHVYSDTTAIHSQTTVIESDAVVIESSVQVIESDLIVAASDVLQIYSDTTIIASDLVLVQSDTTAIESELIVVHSETTVIQSQTTVMESDSIIIESSVQAIEAAGGALTAAQASTLDAIESELIVVHSETTVIQSDTVVIESSVQVVESDLIVAASDVLQIYSDTTIIASDVVQIYSDTTTIASDAVLIYSDTAAIESAGGSLTAAQASTLEAIESELIVVHSDTTAIHSDTTIIASDVVLIYSDTTAIHSQTTVIESDSVVIESSIQVVESDLVIVASDLLQVYSDTTHIDSDIVVIGGQATTIASDLVIIASDLLQVYSDTTVIASDVVLVYSDTTAIHSQTTVIESDSVVIESSIAVVESQTTVIESDVALFEVSRAEPGQGNPAASASALLKIDYLYKAWRNKTEQTSTQYSLYNDAGDTVDQKATVSDDGTTFTREEIETGP